MNGTRQGKGKLSAHSCLEPLSWHCQAAPSFTGLRERASALVCVKLSGVVNQDQQRGPTAAWCPLCVPPRAAVPDRVIGPFACTSCEIALPDSDQFHKPWAHLLSVTNSFSCFILSLFPVGMKRSLCAVFR